MDTFFETKETTTVEDIVTLFCSPDNHPSVKGGIKKEKENTETVKK